ncbi:MAG TPA: sterol desaturase family protein [Thermoanaerobaculia bacterium]|nr:sterol desaturase family protein [Thermoanaerobaculia bacterium]
MNGWLEGDAAMLRAGSCVAVFVVMAVAETVFEERPRRVARRSRWVSNLGLTLLNTAVLRLLFPIGAVSAALWSATNGAGLLQVANWPAAMEFVLAIVLLDLVIYAQHVLFHSVPLLFAIHKVHHTDIDFDVTLGSRFHPLELLLSMGIKLAAVSVIGASVPAVIVFETLLAVTSLFNHANVHLPRRIDRALRWLIVTPAMHSIHHSAERRDRDTNFGFSIPWWDRLFGTYRVEASSEHPGIGLPDLQNQTRQTLRWLLTLPFRSAPSAIVTGRSRTRRNAA